MDIIVRGEPHEIDFVRCICRDKVRRGVIAILPATGPASDEVVKLRNERDETTKENEKLTIRVAELESQLSNVDTSTDNVDTSTANVDSNPISTDSAEVESDPENSGAMDNKYIDNDDFQEVDLDADEKTITENDTKDIPSDDAQEKSTAKKTPRRSKKSE